MGVGPIPWSSIERYATRHHLDNDELETLDHHIRVIEAAMSEWEAKRPPEKPEPGKDSPTDGR